MGQTSELHRLLNRERTKRKLPYARWDHNLWKGCKKHSNYMLGNNILVHAATGDIPSGGECICGGKGNQSPYSFVNSWMNSPLHKSLILDPNIKCHAVAISNSKYGTYATWRGSLSIFHIPLIFTKIFHLLKLFRRRFILSSNPFKLCLSLILGFIGLLGITVGIHGIYVYFNRLDLYIVSEGSRLFLAIDVPVRFQDLVIWASARGLQSWFLPLLIAVAGLWLFNYSRIWDFISRLFNKLRP